MQNGFRADIEGLRALAVVPIVLFHLNAALCPGGYIGVDIFFVISGYLITRMIVQSGAGFSFRNFYYRRFHRLFPALLTTCQASLIAGWMIMTPADYAQLSWSALAAAFGMSNIYFYGTLNYFSDANIFHPLLHTWSLGTEEQFYLFWPALIVLALRKRLSLLVVLLAAAALSFLAALYALNEDASLSFYMMPFRIFEFAAGASLVKLEPVWEKFSRQRFDTALGAAGAAMLACAFFYFSEYLPWPGPATLVPTLATMLLILAGRHGPWHNFLGNGLCRYLGRISYSLYLVHWPIVVFYRYYLIVTPSNEQLVLMGVASLAAGSLMYHLIETPFRHRPASHQSSVTSAPWKPLQAALRLWPSAQLPILVVSSLLFMAASVAVIAANGYPSRVEQNRAQSNDKGLSFAGDLCDPRRSRCIFGDRQARRTVYVLGDSHALNLIHGLDKLFRSEGIKGIALYDHGCLFAIGTKRFLKGRADLRCAERVQAAFDYLKGTNAPVIFAGFYAGYRNAIGPADATSALQQSESEYYSWLGDRLTASFSYLNARGRPFVIFKHGYSTGIDLAKCLNRPSNSVSGAKAADHCRSLSRTEVARLYRGADEMIDRLAAAIPKLHVIDPKQIICKTEVCTTRSGSELFFRDRMHLTYEGSDYLISGAKPALLTAIRPR